MSFDLDAEWFKQFPERQAHIRMPLPRVLTKNRQRAVRFVPECDWEFRTLGDHDVSRRRIILWKVPVGNPHYDPKNLKILKVPFLAFSDESIADEDSVLLPILEEIMQEAARKLDHHVLV